MGAGSGSRLSAVAEPPRLVAKIETTAAVERLEEIVDAAVLQAVDRLKMTDAVYVAFPESAPVWRRHWRRVRDLARRVAESYYASREALGFPALGSSQGGDA